MLERLRGLALVPALLWASAGGADEILSYLNLSSRDKLHSQVGLLLGRDVASVQADVTLEGEGGKTRVLPRITSTFGAGDWLDVRSVLSYGDWNSVSAAAPSMATKIVLRSAVPMLDRIEGTVRHTAREVNQSLRFGFADFGMQALGGTPVNVKTALTVQSGGNAPPPSLSSSVAFGRTLDVAGSWGVGGHAYDTKVVYRVAAPAIEQVVAGLRRSPSGELLQSIGVRFPELLRARELDAPLQIRSGATLEETLAPNGVETLRMGLETSIAGIRPSLVGGSSKLSMKLEQPLEEQRPQRASLAYDHAWAPGDESSIALNLKMLREAGEVEPSLGVSWRARF